MIAITQYIGSYFLGFVIIGAGIAVFSAAGKLKDSDIDEQVGNNRKQVAEKAIKDFGFNEKQLKNITNHDFGEFEFPEGVTLHVKRGSDSKFRSSVYDAWSVLISPDSIYIYVHRFNLAEPDETFAQHIIKLDDYAGSGISDHIYVNRYGKNNEKSREVKYQLFDIRTNGGETISLPVHDDMNIDELIKKLDRTAETRHKGKTQNQ